jgi:hypothetical protein
MMRSRFTAGALAALLALGLAACGDDDGGGDEASPEAAGATTTAPAGGMAPEACDAYVQLAGLVADAPEGPEASAYIESEILPVVQTLEESGGEEIADQVTTLIDIATASVEDPSQFEDPAGQQSYSEIGGVVHDGCGFAQQEVTGVEYEFQGIPDTIDAGTTSFSFTNGGTEEHEMVMFRRADGETRSFEELLALPEDEAESAVEFQAATFSPIGATTYAIADLEPGTYATICFIPVGGAEDGPPHFTEGMLREFEVS